MLKPSPIEDDSRPKVVEPALHHAKAVLTFIYDQLIRQNTLRLLFVATVGAIARFLNLLTFVGALKGLIVAINSEVYAEFLQRILARGGYDVPISGSTVILLVILTLIAINLIAIPARHIRFLGVSNLQKRFLDRAVQNLEEVELRSDRFLIDRVAPAIDNLVRLTEILLFSLMIFVTVAFINLNFVLLLLPLFALIPLAGLLARRSRLRLRQQKRNALREYEAAFRESKNDPERLRSWTDVERRAYVSTSQALTGYQLRTQQISSVVVAVGFIALIAYIPFLEIKSMQLLSIPLPIIFIALAIRQVLSQANEVGRDLSTLLELRDGLQVISPKTTTDVVNRKGPDKPSSGLSSPSSGGAQMPSCTGTVGVQASGN